MLLGVRHHLYLHLSRAGNASRNHRTAMISGSKNPGCAYCGLPLPVARSWNGKSSPLPDLSQELAYCCFGCRFAASVAGANGPEGQAGWVFARLGLALFFTMNVMVFSMALW